MFKLAELNDYLFALELSIDHKNSILRIRCNDPSILIQRDILKPAIDSMIESHYYANCFHTLTIYSSLFREPILADNVSLINFSLTIESIF